MYRDFPDVQTIAEESTAWPQVSRPNYVGGLGFGMKWNMGWMHDTLGYFKRDPVYRKHHHDELTFSLWYAFHENFVLPLSHDEVVHGKGSLIGRMPGDAWQQFANLRLLFGYMWAHPGKKLLFMGGEFGQRREWTHEDSLEWHVLDQDPRHEGVQRWVADLNRVYATRTSLHEKDFSRRRLPLGAARRLGGERAVLPATEPGQRPGAGGVQLHARSRATTIASACRAAGAGASCSTAMPSTTAAAAWATRAAWRRSPCRTRTCSHSLDAHPAAARRALLQA